MCAPTAAVYSCHMIERSASQTIFTESVVDKTVHELRRLIVSGTYPANSRLSERALAGTFGISTIAVREALLRVQNEGLVYRMPRRGAFVSEITAKKVQDLAAIRTALEQLAVDLAIGQWNPVLQARGQAIVDRMATVDLRESVDEFKTLDREFHSLFVAAAASEPLTEIMQSMEPRIAMYMNYGAETVNEQLLPGVVAMHQEWLDAIDLRDRAAARDLVADHILQSSSGIIARLSTSN